jgi:hypothetical protein
MASSSTRRVSDGTPVAWADAVSAWAAAARPVLEGIAQTYSAYVTYSELAEAVQEASGIRTGVPFRHWVGQVLGSVARSPLKPGEPMLTSLVVHADGTVGAGYGIPVAERDDITPVDLDMHAAAERLACYRYFGAEMPADGGRPMLTRQLAIRRRRSRQAAAAQRREVCPICFVQLPLSGRCDTCGAE